MNYTELLNLKIRTHKLRNGLIKRYSKSMASALIREKINNGLLPKEAGLFLPENRPYISQSDKNQALKQSNFQCSKCKNDKSLGVSRSKNGGVLVLCARCRNSVVPR